MGRIVKVRCNGQNKHVNDVDIDKALTTVLITRDTDMTTQSMPPVRIVLPCRECTGNVIFTRKMIEDIKKQHG